MLRRHAGPLTFGLVAVAAGAALGFWGWPQPHRTFELAGLIFAAIVAGLYAIRPSVATDWMIAPVSLVIDLTALLLLGRDAATMVAVAGVVARALDDAQPRRVI